MMICEQRQRSPLSAVSRKRGIFLVSTVYVAKEITFGPRIAIYIHDGPWNGLSQNWIKRNNFVVGSPLFIAVQRTPIPIDYGVITKQLPDGIDLLLSQSSLEGLHTTRQQYKSVLQSTNKGGRFMPKSPGTETLLNSPDSECVHPKQLQLPSDQNKSQWERPYLTPMQISLTMKWQLESSTLSSVPLSSIIPPQKFKKNKYGANTLSRYDTLSGGDSISLDAIGLEDATSDGTLRDDSGFPVVTRNKALFTNSSFMKNDRVVSIKPMLLPFHHVYQSLLDAKLGSL